MKRSPSPLHHPQPTKKQILSSTEEAVGITCYYDTEIKGFSATIKKRWSDFAVFEIRKRINEDGTERKFGKCTQVTEEGDVILWPDYEEMDKKTTLQDKEFRSKAANVTDDHITNEAPPIQDAEINQQEGTDDAHSADVPEREPEFLIVEEIDSNVTSSGEQHSIESEPKRQKLRALFVDNDSGPQRFSQEIVEPETVEQIEVDSVRPSLSRVQPKAQDDRHDDQVISPNIVISSQSGNSSDKTPGKSQSVLSTQPHKTPMQTPKQIEQTPNVPSTVYTDFNPLLAGSFELSVPSGELIRSRQLAKTPVKHNELTPPSTIPVETQNKLLSFFGQSATRLFNLTPAQMLILEWPMTCLITLNKEERTELHHLIAKFLPLLQSEAKEGVVTLYPKRTPGRRTGNKNKNKPKGTGDSQEANTPYLVFTLHKTNRDTMEAVSTMAMMLRCGMQSFGFAGTKDKRAITTQAVSVSGITRSRLDALALRLKGFSITNIVPSAVPVFLGDLIGNMFVIILRDVDNLPSYTALPSFINYFGLQRFGNSTIATHDIGKSLLASKFKEAVDLILLPRVGCEMNKAREDWQKNRSPKSAFDLFPRKAIAERAVLKFLMSEFQRKGGEESWDWCGAVVSIPKSLKLMYVHSYQSYVFNRVASFRLGLNRSALAGDLIRCNDQVVPILAEDLQRLDIHQVVLPLPGTNVEYPANVRHIYERILAEDGLTINDFKHNVRCFRLGGDYRNIVVQPKTYLIQAFKYDSDTEDLLNRPGTAHMLKPTSGSKDGMLLQFSLPSSCYATMALREFLKQDSRRDAMDHKKNNVPQSSHA